MVGRRRRSEWLAEPNTSSRRSLWHEIVREVGGFVLGTLLMFCVGLVGFHIGKDAERVTLFLGGVCRLPPEPTQMHGIALHSDEALKVLRVKRL